MDAIWQALGHFFGLDNLSGANYGFWSGVGSDIQEVVLVGGVYVLLRHHNCHVRGCWRLGRIVPGIGRHACKRHHPAHSVTHEELLAEHAAATSPTLQSADRSAPPED